MIPSTTPPRNSDAAYAGGSDACRIAMVGDSLVAEGRWSAWLPFAEVLNLGVPGHTSDDMLGRLGDLVDAAPHEIVMVIGTNDLSAGRSVERLVRNVEIALVHVRRELPGSRLLLVSIPPRQPEYAPLIKEANIHLRQFCATVRAHYLDLWPALADERNALRDDLTDDGLHLNDRGYREWVDELLPALERMREHPPMSRPIPIIGAGSHTESRFR